MIDDDPQVTADQKAGRSSWCRREQHQTCSLVKARCACGCHGRTAQSPPPPLAVVPPLPPVQIVPEPQEAAVPDPESVPEVTAVEELACSECERTFGSVHARAVHLARTHKIRSEGRATPKPERRTPPQPEARAGAHRRPCRDRHPRRLRVHHPLPNPPRRHRGRRPPRAAGAMGLAREQLIAAREVLSDGE